MLGHRRWQLDRRSWMRGLISSIVAFLTVWTTSLAAAAPVLNYMTYTEGTDGQPTILVGTWGTPQSVTFQEQTGGAVYTITYNNSIPAGTFTDPEGTFNYMVINVPNGMATSGTYTYYNVYLTDNTGKSNNLTFHYWTPASIGATDIKPHGDFSLPGSGGPYPNGTSFCLQCHMVHKGNNLGTNPTSQNPYALLAENSVQAVCQTCHGVNGNSATGVLSPNPGFGNETIATAAHYGVYKNTGAGTYGHVIGTSIGAAYDADTNVSLSYLNLNTTSYQTANGYDTGAYAGAAQGSANGLYCGSCHTPHGDYSANLWYGWNAAKFSENYGYATGDDATGIAASSGLVANFSSHIPVGALPLTTALLIDNPGHQGGIGNADTNPNVPLPYPGSNTNSTEMTNEPVAPTWGQISSTLGQENDTLSDWCVGCHNLNGGEDSQMNGHPTHPLQAVLSPNNAGSSTTYSSPQGAYAYIANGCTSCHGAQVGVVNTGIGGGYSFNMGNWQSSYDFPHSSTVDYLLKAPPDGLCLACHAHHEYGWNDLSSLP